MCTQSIEHQRYVTRGSFSIHPRKARSIGMLQIITCIKKVENDINDDAAPDNHYVMAGNDFVRLTILSVMVGNGFVRPGNHFVMAGNNDATPIDHYVTAGNDDVKPIGLLARPGSHFERLDCLVATVRRDFVTVNCFVAVGSTTVPPAIAAFLPYGYILTNFALHYLSLGRLPVFLMMETKPRRKKNAERSKKMAKTSYKQSSVMLRFKTILDNIRKPDMLNPLADHGYNAEKIDEGDALFAAGNTAIDNQKKARSEKVKATRALSILEKAVRGTFADHVKMARRALSDAANHINDLGISGQMGRSLADWTDTAKAFYTTALATPDILAKLARFNITETVLQQGLSDIAGLLDVNSDQEEKKGIAQQFTELKKKAIAELTKWIGDLLAACRIAYKDDLQQLERLTITVYSEGYKPKKPDTEPDTDPTEPTDPTDPIDPTDPGQGGEPTT